MAAGVRATAGAGVGAGSGATRGRGAIRWMTIGFGLGFTAGGARWEIETRAILTGTSSSGADGGAGSVAAWTIAGAVPPGSIAKGGVWPPSGPARKRGNAAAPTTAPVSSTAATTPLVIALMVPTPNADGITRTRYRQVGTRA